MHWLRLACVGVAAAVSVQPIAAQDYPTKPIRMIVVTAPGGLMDVAARITAEYVGKALGQTIVIENRSGGAGNIGAEAIAKAAPDGYTIGLIQLGNVAINPYLYKDLSFDPLNDLIPVAPVTSSAIFVVASSNMPDDLKGLIALAKQQPGKLNYGSGGAGTVPHLAGEMFAHAAGIKIAHVPYRGVGPAVNDLIGGHIQMTFAGWGAVRGPVEAKRANALAVAQPQRLKSAPDVPTTAEAGLPEFEFLTWFGVVAPKGMPAAIVAKLAHEIHVMQDNPAVQAQLAAGGLEALKETPEQFGARIRRDHQRFGVIIKAADLKPQ